MRVTMLATVLVACTLLAQRTSSTSVEKIRILRYQPATMRDGVKLYGDVYMPAKSGRYPVLVSRTPYGVQRDGMHQTGIRFAQHGYAYVLQDVRGRYESEGKW